MGSETATSFAIGERVVVSERYRGAGCNHGAVGFYGHVVTLPDETKGFSDRYFGVAFRGHINGPSATGYGFYMRYGDDLPFPCYAFELDHAD